MEQPNPHATATEDHTPRARSLQQETPPQWEAHALQQRRAPFTPIRENPCTAMKTQPANQSIKIKAIEKNKTW